MVLRILDFAGLISFGPFFFLGSYLPFGVFTGVHYFKGVKGRQGNPLGVLKGVGSTKGGPGGALL